MEEEIAGVEGQLGPLKIFLGNVPLPIKHVSTCHAAWKNSNKNNLAHSKGIFPYWIWPSHYVSEDGRVRDLQTRKVRLGQMALSPSELELESSYCRISSSFYCTLPKLVGHPWLASALLWPLEPSAFLSPLDWIKARETGEPVSFTGKSNRDFISTLYFPFSCSLSLYRPPEQKFRQKQKRRH